MPCFAVFRFAPQARRAKGKRHKIRHAKNEKLDFHGPAFLFVYCMSFLVVYICVGTVSAPSVLLCSAQENVTQYQSPSVSRVQ